MLSSEVKGTSMKNTLLRAARLQNRWSQQQLADFAGVSLSTVERAERGEPSRVDNIERLCACLQKTPEQLEAVREGLGSQFGRMSLPGEMWYNRSR